MFRIFYDTLVRPKTIVNHVDCKKGKFIGFILILIILFMIPCVLAVNSYIKYTSDEALIMAQYILDEEPIEYEIKDGKMTYTGSGEESVRFVELPISNANAIYVQNPSLTVLDKPIYLVFSLDGLGYEVNKEEAYLIVFKESEIEIIYRPYKVVDGAVSTAGLNKQKLDEEHTVKTISYGDLEMDFNYNNSYKKNYYLKLYNVGNLIFNSFSKDLIVYEVISLLIDNVINFLGGILITVLLIGLIYRFKGVKFFKVVKIAILCSSVHVVGIVLANLYNIYIIGFIGEFLAFIYTCRVLRQYAIIKFSNISRGN